MTRGWVEVPTLVLSLTRGTFQEVQFLWDAEEQQVQAGQKLRPQWDPPRSFEFRRNKERHDGMLDCKERLEFRGRVEHWNPQIIYIYYIYAIFLFPNMKT